MIAGECPQAAFRRLGDFAWAAVRVLGFAGFFAGDFPDAFFAAVLRAPEEERRVVAAGFFAGVRAIRNRTQSLILGLTHKHLI